METVDPAYIDLVQRVSTGLQALVTRAAVQKKERARVARELRLAKARLVQKRAILFRNQLAASAFLGPVLHVVWGR